MSIEKKIQQAFRLGKIPNNLKPPAVSLPAADRCICKGKNCPAHDESKISQTAGNQSAVQSKAG